jgi:hypothetical protein
MTEAKRRLEHLVLIVMKVMEMVRWDGVFRSLIRPEDSAMAVATTRNMRGCIFTNILFGDTRNTTRLCPLASGRTCPVMRFSLCD